MGGEVKPTAGPLRYDRLPPLHHAADRGAYFAWRLAQGNLRQGLRTRVRRLQGRYDVDEAADYEEYHVVRNGVDSVSMSLVFTHPACLDCLAELYCYFPCRV